MLKKIVFAIIVLVAISAAILYVIPWGNYESNIQKTEILETTVQTDSTGQVVASMDLIEGDYFMKTGEDFIGEILFDIDGLKNTRGAYEKFEVSLTVPDDYTSSTLDVIIDAGSVNTNNSMRDESLVSDEFFDVKKYPEIRYSGKAVELSDTAYVAKGELTLMASTKSLDVPFKHLGSGTYDDGRVFEAFEGVFTFDRTQYGMKEEGGVGNDVKISFYCELVVR